MCTSQGTAHHGSWGAGGTDALQCSCECNGGGGRKQGLEDVTSQKAPDMDTWVRLLDQECLSRVRSLTHTLSPEASHL